MGRGEMQLSVRVCVFPIEQCDKVINLPSGSFMLEYQEIDCSIVFLGLFVPLNSWMNAVERVLKFILLV